MDSSLTSRLTDLAQALVHQERAAVLVEPQARESGYWFGGGSTVADAEGRLWISGRFRNAGDSRTGVGAGERGLELALFMAETPEGPFQKMCSWSKADLACNGRGVVSIEGSALRFSNDGVELLVSTEKEAPYPAEIAGFQKPGTGVWSIDRMAAPRVEDLDASTLREVVGFGPAERLHAKDPVLSDLPDGSTALFYCTHPYTWSSSGTAVSLRRPGAEHFEPLSQDILRRGPVWDIAAARVTERLPVPKRGRFAELPDQSVYFYDSCESLRPLEENVQAVQRPRGYSCEEIGGLAHGLDAAFPSLASLTVLAPLLVSPQGTGCSRYVSVATLPSGLFATWQQSQQDRSQPLVGHHLPMEEVEGLLGG